MSLPIKPAKSCAFDQISLGEVMLRLDPGEGRIRTTREFKVWEGGGEYNTSRGLRKCFTAKKNDWSATLWHAGKFYESRKHPGLEILDRVGGGDSFSAARSSASWNSTTRNWPWIMAPLTGPWLPPLPAIPRWPPARKSKNRSAAAVQGL